MEQPLIASLEALQERMEQAELPDASQMQELWHILTRAASPEETRPVLEDERFALLAAFFAPRWAAFLGLTEQAYTRRLLDSNEPAASLLSLEDYDPHVSELALLPDGRAAGHFMMAGCGAYPETLLRLQREGRFSRLTGLDENAASLRLAEQIFSCEAGTDGTFIAGRAQEQDYTGVDVLLLANGLRHKAATLARAASLMRPGSVILARSPLLLGTLLYEEVGSLLPPEGLRPVGRIQPSILSVTLALEVA